MRDLTKFAFLTRIIKRKNTIYLDSLANLIKGVLRTMTDVKVEEILKGF